MIKKGLLLVMLAAIRKLCNISTGPHSNRYKIWKPYAQTYLKIFFFEKKTLVNGIPYPIML